MIPSIGDCISMCAIVVNVATAYVDAPSNFRQFSIHASYVAKKLEDIDRKERKQGLYIRNAPEDSRIEFKDMIELMRQALQPVKEIQPLYHKIEKRLLEREREAPGSLPKDLEVALQEHVKNPDAVPGKPLRELENLPHLLGRKWKQGQFALKADTIAVYQARLDRAIQALNLFLSDKTDQRTFMTDQTVNEIHGLVKEMYQILPARGLEVPKLVYTEREKLSVLFVDEENTDSSVLAATYASLIRLWALVNSGSSPYSRISSAGLYVSSSLITPTLYPSLTLHEPGTSPFIPTLRTVFPGEQDEDNQCAASFVGSRCSETRRVKLRTYAHLSRGLNVSDFETYDLIIAMNQDIFFELEALRDHVSQTIVREGKAMPKARVRLLESYGFKGNGGMEERLRGFTEYETSWWAPPRRRLGKRAETHCAFRTRESVCSLGVREARKAIGDTMELGVVVEVLGMDVKEGTRERKSLVCVTGKYSSVEKVMEVLEGKLSLRKF